VVFRCSSAANAEQPLAFRVHSLLIAERPPAVIQGWVAEIAEQLRRLGCSERQAALHAEQLFRARMTVRKHPEIIVESETGRPGRKRGWR
jgi:hypothetical protein